MKKTTKFLYIRKIFNYLIFSCLLFFNYSCGLDTFPYLNEPRSTIHPPSPDSAYDEAYFDFWTSDASNSGIPDITFTGTDIYYKIFSDSSSLESECNRLQALAGDSSNSSQASTKLIESFKPLRALNYKSSPLIPAKNFNQRVYIRLTDYQDDSSYAARIVTIESNREENLGNSDKLTIPMRSVNGDSDRSFNFGRGNEKGRAESYSYEAIPNSSHPDTSGQSSDSYWYVALFAVSTGVDTTYTNYYSNILYLGAVKIDSNSWDN